MNPRNAQDAHAADDARAAKTALPTAVESANATSKPPARSSRREWLAGATAAAGLAWGSVIADEPASQPGQATANDSAH